VNFSFPAEHKILSVQNWFFPPFLCDSVSLCAVNLFDHLPSDALEAGESEKDLAKATAGVVLTVADVVLQVYLEIKEELGMKIGYNVRLSRSPSNKGYCLRG
jgi:hypothetical protein